MGGSPRIHAWERLSSLANARILFSPALAVGFQIGNRPGAKAQTLLCNRFFATLKHCPRISPGAPTLNQGPHLNARGRIASGYPAFGFTSSPNIVRCYHESRLRVNQNCHFGTRAAVGERWSQSRDAGASNGCEFHNSLLIHCYSLFFLADKNRKFP